MKPPPDDDPSCTADLRPMTRRAPTVRNLVLIGLSCTGKSVVGRLLAARLGWTFVDTDAEIVARAGKSVARIFAEEGEPAFRQLERVALRAALAGERRVVATGGGAVLDEENRRLMLGGNLVVCLTARPETVLARLRAAAAAEPRPLLAGPDPLGRLAWMAAERAPFYAIAQRTIPTDDRTPEQVLEEIVSLLPDPAPTPTPRLPAEPGDRSAAPLGHSERPWGRSGTGSPPLPGRPGVPLRLLVRAGAASYPALVGPRALDATGAELRQLGFGGRVRVVADERAWALHGARLERALAEAEYEALALALPLGEEAKTLATAERVYDWLIATGTERGDCLLAFGGGVAGDLGGFVAATYLRGIRLVQAPTTLLAQVDSAIGGKVAVNHRLGKNLIGAFHQPVLVLADTSLLATLPRRELVAGWAEVVKMAFTLDAAFFAQVEALGDPCARLDQLAPSIARAIELKGGIVGADERESGLRMVLNYGHTIGHAIEAVTDYRRYLHGEAVAIGMAGAARIAEALGLLDPALRARQDALLARLGLPQRCPGLDPAALRAAMSRDKKVSAGAISWVLPTGLGATTVRRDVPGALVDAVLAALCAG